MDSNEDGPQDNIAMAYTDVDGGVKKMKRSNCYFFVGREGKGKRKRIRKTLTLLYNV